MRRNHLLQLLADNRRAYTPMAQRVHRAADGAGPVTIYLYDPIVSDRWMAEYFGGVCPQDFVPALSAIDAQEINLRINCPGGEIFAAEAMCQAIREHSATVTAHIEGLAASSATSITCACDRVLATPASQFMVHEGWCWALGNKGELRRVADLLQSLDETLLQEYQRRTGQSLEQLRQWIEAETWFTAQQAAEAGFVDEVKAAGGGKAAKAQASARAWNLSAYAHAPKVEVPADVPEPPNTAASGDLRQLPGGRVPGPPPTASDDHRARQQQRLRIARLLQPVE